jgi:nucleoside-diphosphate-sugar epimerase
MNWSPKRILVTGGASFIGSHVVDDLVSRGATRIRVVDDLSSGVRENIERHIDSGLVEFLHDDLLVPGTAERAMDGVTHVFHLAAIHGGRGYVDLHQAECAKNLTLDGLIVRAAHAHGVEKFVFASSGCVYPNYKQGDVNQELYLSENMVGPPYDCDHMYGWAKLMCEMTLQALHRDHGMRSVSCRLFTVYGERGVENHAVMAMIARAFVGQKPFEIWGDGSQIRNWTYVGDIARGIVMAAESAVEDGTPVNLGTTERTKVVDAAHEVLSYTGLSAEIRYLTDMPTGPLNRVADNRRARDLMGWEPHVTFMNGLHRTIDWYFGTHDPAVVRGYLGRMLTERGSQPTEAVFAAERT